MLCQFKVLKECTLKYLKTTVVIHFGNRLIVDVLTNVNFKFTEIVTALSFPLCSMFYFFVAKV